MEMGRERRRERQRERGRLGAAKRACNEDSVKGKLGRRRRVFVAVWWVYVCVCVCQSEMEVLEGVGVY